MPPQRGGRSRTGELRARGVPSRHPTMPGSGLGMQGTPTLSSPLANPHPVWPLRLRSRVSFPTCLPRPTAQSRTSRARVTRHCGHSHPSPLPTSWGGGPEGTGCGGAGALRLEELKQTIGSEPPVAPAVPPGQAGDPVPDPAPGWVLRIPALSLAWSSPAGEAGRGQGRLLTSLGLRVRTCLAHVLALQAFSLRRFARRQ